MGVSMTLQGNESGNLIYNIFSTRFWGMSLAIP